MEKLAITIVAFLSLLSIGAGAPISCPTAEDLYPCVCKRMAYGLHIVCEKFNNSAALVKAFKVLRDFPVQNVLLHELMMKDVLPSDLFDGLAISELRVQKSKLKFPLPAFTGLDKSLHILNVAQHTTIKSTEHFSLAHLNMLTDLNIKANPLGTVRDQFLNGKIPNVRSIKLEEDEIVNIESNAFANLPHLELISMADNRIKKIERSMFPRPASVLKTIDLRGNEIDKLPSDIFFDMPKLEEIILSINDLKTLPENTWKSVWEQLNTVLLFENNLICDKNLDWIKKLRWPRQVVGNCVAPSKMVGKSLQEVYNT